MNNALWLCLQTNRLAFYQEPTARFFELAFRPANTNVCQKRKKEPDPFIFHNTPPIVNGEAKTHIKM